MELASIAILAIALVGGAFVRWRSGLERLEAKLRRLRELAARDIELRPLADGHAAGSELVALTDQLREHGLTSLGYAIEETEGHHATRWFVDAAGTTFGWVGIARGVRVAYLMSIGSERTRITRCIPRRLPALAQPPFVDRDEQIGPLQLGGALAAHRARLPERAVAVATLDDALREVRALRARSVAWRASQPPDELLERDLRGILGHHYARLGARMARRLGVRLPEARSLSR